MPQISPIFWTFVIILLTIFLMVNTESLPGIIEKSKNVPNIKNKEKTMKW